MIALFITSMVFFTSLGVAMNIRDARREHDANTEAKVNQLKQSEVATL